MSLNRVFARPIYIVNYYVVTVVFIQDADALTSCMTFMRAIARCDDITREFAPLGFLRDCWTQLVTILKHLYSGTRGKGLMESTEESKCSTTEGNTSRSRSSVTHDDVSTELQNDIKETLAVIIGTLSLAEFSQIIHSLVDQVVSVCFKAA